MATKEKKGSEPAPIVTELPAPTLVRTSELLLDKMNPRLGGRPETQSADGLFSILLDKFKVEELAESILASGYLPFDPMLGMRTSKGVVVLEGNRRLAALRLLLQPELVPDDHKNRWKGLTDRLTPDKRRTFERIPVHIFESRDDPRITAYMGFRHVTGAEDWPSYEKAGFIVKMVDELHADIAGLGPKLGHRGGTVTRHYLAYKLAHQALAEEVPGATQMRELFGVLLRALNSPGILSFMGVSSEVHPGPTWKPVPADHAEAFKEFVRWTFGTDEQVKVLQDSRDLTKWGTVLSSAAALRYMRRQSDTAPDFKRAWALSGGEASSLMDTLFSAADRLQDAVAVAPSHTDEKDVIEGVRQCARFLRQILASFPDLQRESGLTVVAPA